MHSILNVWAWASLKSIGVEVSNTDVKPSLHVVYDAMVTFLVVSLCKLTLAAYAWSWGFIFFGGGECWGLDETFSHPPNSSKCILASFFVSGFMASVVLCATVYICENYVIGLLFGYSTPSGSRRNSTNIHTYIVLLISVFFSDASWSFFNWLSYSMANFEDNDNQSEKISAYAVASIIGFALNGLTFYCMHNLTAITYGGIWQQYIQLKYNKNNNDGNSNTVANVKKIAAAATVRSKIPDNRENYPDLWFCDVLFAGVVSGAYYGFGPFAVMLSQGNSQDYVTVSFYNAVGTLLGSIACVLVLYIFPIVLWWNCYHIVDVKNSLNLEKGIELRDRKGHNISSNNVKAVSLNTFSSNPEEGDVGSTFSGINPMNASQ
jgi:hypothetical protein